MARAVIDIGTNSVLLLVVEGERALVDRARITRLGKGVGGTGRLDAAAIQRTLEVVREYVAEARALGAVALATGTSALRDAANAEDFLGPARELLGSSVRVLSGADEARLTYLGALSGLAAGDVRTVVDIGGGSTEVVTGRGGVISSAVSLQIGAVRLTERFVRTDPPAPEEVGALVEAVRAALGGVGPLSGDLVAVAGTATTLGAMSLGLEPYDGSKVHGLRLSAAELRGMLEVLLSRPTSERARIAGIEPARADVLPAGALILEEVRAAAGAEAITVSDRGLRWGVAAERTS